MSGCKVVVQMAGQWMLRALFVILAAIAPVPAIAALFVIGSPQFAGYVDTRNDYKIFNPAVDGKLSRRSLRGSRLYFSVEIIGDQNTVARLEEYGYLELKVTIWADGSQLDTVPIGISSREWEEDKEVILEQVADTGNFRWRTFLSTKKTWYSKIELVLRDENNTVVSPVSSKGSYSAVVELY